MMFQYNTCRVLFLLSLSLGCAVAGRALLEMEGLAPVGLGSAGNYVILTKAGISTVPTSVITGDIAVSPIAATGMTVFSFVADSTNVFSTSEEITGKAFAADYAVPIPTRLTTAVSDMEAAYTDAAGRPSTRPQNMNSGVLGFGGDFGGANAKLVPGVYTFGSGVTINSTIYFVGSATDVFIIQMTGDLLQVKGTQVILEGGALAENVFWQCSGKVEIGEGAHLQGILLVQTSVLFETEASLKGRVLAQTRADLQKATITAP